jgi:cytochrome c oxidase subunit 2
MRKDPNIIKNVEEVNEIISKKGEPPFEFNYLLLCNKICGLSHYNMQMNIIVDEPADFNAWISKQKTVGESATADQPVNKAGVKTESGTLLAEQKK